ncbi:methyl-accepting chemotaxis protein [Pseudomonas sp. nanlin1]
MSWFVNLKLGAKLTSAFFLCALISLAVGVIGMQGNSRLGTTLAGVLSNNLVSVGATNQVLYNALYHNRNLYRLYLQTISGDEAMVQKTLGSLTELRGKVDREFKLYRSTPLRADELALGDQFEKDWPSYLAASQKFTDTLSSGDIPKARSVLQEEVLPAYHKVEVELQGIITSNVEQGDVAGGDAKALIDSLFVAMCVAILVAFILAIGLGLVITRLITRPIANAVQAAQCVADGDLTRTIEPAGQDETGQLLRALATMQGNLRSTLQNISSASDQLASAAEELNAVTDESSRGLVQQDQEIQSAATAVNQMTAAVDEVARNAVSTSEVSQRTNSEASAGRDQVRQAVVAIETMATEIDGSTQLVKGLAAQTQDISKVLDVIRAIADQTNLLALNAAIEAARAGEQGRGFAVVADEVRALAHRTQASTGEIEGMINAAQSSAEQVVGAMAKSQTLAASTRDLAQAAGTALESITDGVAQISERNLVIASASEQQAQVAREVDRNLVNIQGLSAQTATGAQQTAASSNELSRLAISFNTMVAKFRL